MNLADLAAIKARADAATPGPWSNDYALRHMSVTDRLFVLHARSDVPALLEAIDVLRGMLVDAETEAQMQAAEVERLKKVIERQRQVVGRNPTPEEYNRSAAKANCDRSPCSCGMHRDRT